MILVLFSRAKSDHQHSDNTNKGNFSKFDLTNDLHWYAMNVLFMKGKLRDQGLGSFSEYEVENNIKEELYKIYS